MKPLSNIIITLAVPLIAASVIACDNEKKLKTETINETIAAGSDTFIYDFQDASVPPPYHRSYTIRVTAELVYFAISDYSQILSKDSLVLTRTAYDSFVTAINNLHIKKGKEIIQEGCTGGTSDKLDLFRGSSKEVKGYIYYCGGQKYGDLEGDVALAANLFKALIPDLDKRIDATIKND